MATYNHTDGVSSAFVRTKTATGIRLTPPGVSADTKNFTHSTGIQIGGGRTIIADKIKVVTVAGASPNSGVGIAISAGGITHVFQVHAGTSGNFQMQVVAGVRESYNTYATTWSDGDDLDVVFDIDHDAGEVIISYSVNGGPRAWGSFTGVITGPVDLHLATYGRLTFEHSLQITSVPRATQPVALPDTLSCFGKLLERKRPALWSPPVALPDDFKVYHYAGKFSTSYDNIQSPLTDADHCAVVYVSPTGSDLASGSVNDPLASLALALETVKAVSRALIRPSPGNYRDRLSCIFSPIWANAKSRVVAIVPTGTGRVASAPLCNGLVWADEGASTWSAPLTLVGSAVGVWDKKSPDDDGDNIPLTARASIALVKANAGSFFFSGSRVYVHTADSRAPDLDLLVYDNFRGALAYAVPDGLIYAERVDIAGSSKNFFSNQASPYTGKTNMILRDITSADATINNLWHYGSGMCVTVGALLRKSLSDSISYGSYPGSGGTSNRAIEVDVVSRSRGGGSADQASTTHSGTVSVRVNGDYMAIGGQGIADVGDAWSWMLGCKSQGGTVSPVAYLVGNTPGDVGKFFLDRCSAVATATAVDTSTAAAVYTANFDAGGGAISGNVSSYIP